jgi:ankyrin repeat protein
LGNTEIVQALIAAGADINFQDINGYTALDYGKSFGNKLFFRLI